MTTVCAEQSQRHTFSVEWKGQFIRCGHNTVNTPMGGSQCIMHWGVGYKLTQRFLCPSSAYSLLGFDGSISY